MLTSCVAGLCTNRNCPYRHVNVNPKASICEEFLRGYCANGNEVFSCLLEFPVEFVDNTNVSYLYMEIFHFTSIFREQNVQLQFDDLI